MTNTSTSPRKRPAWLTLDPKKTRFSKFTWIVLGILLLVVVVTRFNTKALWIAGWEHHLNCWTAFQTIKGASGHAYRGCGWMKQRTVYVYPAPGVSPRQAQVAAEGLRSLLDDLQLDFRVIEQTPPGAEKSLAAAMVNNRFDYDRFIKQTLDRRGMRYAEIVVVGQQFSGPCWWAFGMSLAGPGVAVLQDTQTDTRLARHEGAHMLGYMYHDDAPWYILGYREAANPLKRDTLMMLDVFPNPNLSERAHDALLAFWRGMERRDHQRYFKPNTVNKPSGTR